MDGTLEFHYFNIKSLLNEKHVNPQTPFRFQHDFQARDKTWLFEIHKLKNHVWIMEEIYYCTEWL
jgi:hypothetical protein